MTTIVFNTLTAAVSEWDTPFTSLSPTRATSAAGLLALGGDDDAGAPIAARVLMPETDLASPAKKRMAEVYVSGELDENTPGSLLVRADGEDYDYELQVRPNGIARGVPGRGLWAHRAAIGYANDQGADFRIDRLDIPYEESAERRI